MPEKHVSKTLQKPKSYLFAIPSTKLFLDWFVSKVKSLHQFLSFFVSKSFLVRSKRIGNPKALVTVEHE